MIEPMDYERIKKEVDDKLFKVIETEDCLQKCAVRLANFIFDNSHDIATDKIKLPLTVGWEFEVRGRKYQTIMNIQEVEK